MIPLCRSLRAVSPTMQLPYCKHKACRLWLGSGIGRVCRSGPRVRVGCKGDVPNRVMVRVRARVRLRLRLRLRLLG